MIAELLVDIKYDTCGSPFQLPWSALVYVRCSTMLKVLSLDRFSLRKSRLCSNLWDILHDLILVFMPRVDEVASTLVDPVETRDEGTDQFLHEHDEGTCSVEDEGRTSNASSSSQQHSLMWEPEDVDAPQCMCTIPLYGYFGVSVLARLQWHVCVEDVDA